MTSSLTFTVHGARGSVAIDRADSARYGGATICISTLLGGDHYLVLDAGTGLRDLQHHVPEGDGLTFTFLVTHFHWDHLLGLPFFKPLYRPESTFEFYGSSWEDVGVEEGVGSVMSQPLFPISLAEAPSAKTFHEVIPGGWKVGPASITAVRLHHPQGVTAYRVEHEGRSLVLATDVETGEPDSDRDLVELATGADVLIHDGQYLPSEMEMYEGWGHSTWLEAVEVAERAGVGRLVLISHDPERTDDGVDQLVSNARERFPNTDAAFAGMQLEL